jgi:hypothetical protein
MSNTDYPDIAAFVAELTRQGMAQKTIATYRTDLTHFVPGQTYDYRMAMDMRISMSGIESNETATMGSIVRYHILRVDRSGGADAEIRMSTMTMSTTIGGSSIWSPHASSGVPTSIHRTHVPLRCHLAHILSASSSRTFLLAPQRTRHTAPARFVLAASPG